MKWLWGLVLALLLVSNVGAWELEGRVGKMLYDDAEIRAGESIEVRVKHEDAFVFIENDKLLMYGGWFDVTSVGVGFTKDLFYFKVGYYMPRYDEDGFGEEGLYYRQIKYWSPPLAPSMFQHYNVNYKANFGGEVGVDFKREVFDNLFVGINGAYRYLRLNEFICGWNDGGAPGVTGWILEQNRDFGGWKVGVTIEWRF